MRFLIIPFSVFLFAATASAAPVTFNFSVLLSHATIGGVSVGTVLNGTFTYDVALATTIGISSNRNYSFNPGDTDFTFTANNGFTRSGSLSIQVVNDNNDVYEVSMFPGVNEQVFFTLRDTSASAWNNTLLHTDPTLADITDLSHFADTAPPENDQMNFLFQDFTTGAGGQLFGDIISFEVAADEVAVPAPGAIFLLGIGLIGIAAYRRSPRRAA